MGDEKVVVAQVNGREEQLRAEEILFAGGRVPRVNGLGLEQAGVEVGPQWHPGSMLCCRQQLKNIWSLGGC